jgi:hypothetical protein
MADKETVEQFAARIKAKYPQYRNVPDDRLVHAIIAKYPEYQSRVEIPYRPISDARISAPPPVGSLRWFKEKGWNLVDVLTNQLPNIGGGVGGALGLASGGPVGAVGGAGIGGITGEAARVPIRKALFGETPENYGKFLREMTSAGAEQAVYEALGQMVRPVSSVARKLARPENARIASEATRLGVDLTGPELAPGPLSTTAQKALKALPISNVIAEQGRAKQLQQGVEVANRIIRAVGEPWPTRAMGIETKEAIERRGAPLFKAQVDKLSSILNVQTMNTEVDITGLKREAADELARIEQLKTRPVDILPRDAKHYVDPLHGVAPDVTLKTAEAAPGRRKILEDIVNMKDRVRFSDLRDLRSKWMGIGPETTELMSNEAKGTAKHYVQQMTAELDDAVRGTPAETTWHHFREFTKRGAAVMEDANLVAMLNKYPERATEMVGKNDVTAALNVRRAVLRFAQKYGTPEQQAMAESAWNKFRSAWFGKNVLGAEGGQIPAEGLLTLAKRIKEVDPNVLKVMFGDQEGQRLLYNTRALGDVMERLNAASPSHAWMFLYTLFGFLASGVTALTGGASRGALVAGVEFIPAPLLAKALYSPRFTRAVITMSKWAASHPNASVANVIRATQMAVQEPTRKREKEPEAETAGAGR